MKQKKAASRVRKGKPVRQIAALPFRLDQNGRMEILVLTSRTTRRFIIPKGWPMKSKADHEAAAAEAAQEAGVAGNIEPEPIGSYRYWKRLRTVFVPIDVAVFPLEVTAELPQWRERRLREKRWMPRDDAIKLIDEPELGSLIGAFRPALEGGVTLPHTNGSMVSSSST